MVKVTAEVFSVSESVDTALNAIVCLVYAVPELLTSVHVPELLVLRPVEEVNRPRYMVLNVPKVPALRSPRQK